MGECIGLDFGTTYTTLSRITKNHQGEETLEAINFGNRRIPLEDVPTILAVNNVDEGSADIGKAAISRMLAADYRIYRGFKMLLSEKDTEILKGKGYSEGFTPERATQLYLDKIFENARTKINDSIEKVIVGVPFVWTVNNDQSNDQKKQAVVNSVKKASGASDVEFRAEPELAGAYFADKIKKIQHDTFQGYILVIDYGGGTLDITLCKASKEKDGSCKLDPIGPGWGAGENHDKNGAIGNAGLRFMETVADITLELNGIDKIEIAQNHIDNNNPDQSAMERKKLYSAFVNDIEEAIINSTDIPKNISRREFRDPRFEGYKSEISDVNAGYNGTIYHVRYGTLIQAFEKCKEELDAALESVKEWIDRVYNQSNSFNDIIDYTDSITGKFKIAMIGGFCNFELTRYHITREIDWLRDAGHNDKRYEYMDEDDRAVAVAHGAALIANNLVLIPHKYPYSLYVYGEKAKDGTVRVNEYGEVEYDKVPNYEKAFRFFEENETYLPGTPVFLRTMTGKEKHHVLAGSIPYMQRKRAEEKDKDKSRPFRTSDLMGLHNTWVYLAIAMEKNQYLTLYIYDEVKFNKLSKEEQEKPINSALIEQPRKYPDIISLMGSLWS